MSTACRLDETSIEVAKPFKKTPSLTQFATKRIIRVRFLDPSSEPLEKASNRTWASKNGQIEARCGLDLTEKNQGLNDPGTVSPRRNDPEVSKTLYFTSRNGMFEVLLRKMIKRLITTKNWWFWMILGSKIVDFKGFRSLNFEFRLVKFNFRLQKNNFRLTFNL